MTPKNKKTTKKTAPLTRPYPVHKSCHRIGFMCYKQIGPHPKIPQKVKFNPTNNMFLVFKCPIIHFLPN